MVGSFSSLAMGTGGENSGWKFRQNHSGRRTDFHVDFYRFLLTGSPTHVQFLLIPAYRSIIPACHDAHRSLKAKLRNQDGKRSTMRSAYPASSALTSDSLCCAYQCTMDRGPWNLWKNPRGRLHKRAYLYHYLVPIPPFSRLGGDCLDGALDRPRGYASRTLVPEVRGLGPAHISKKL